MTEPTMRATHGAASARPLCVAGCAETWLVPDTMVRCRLFPVVALSVALALPATVRAGDESPPVPANQPFVGEIYKEGQEGPEIRAPLVETPPVLDGSLDDACWKEAFCASGFYRPDRNQPATEETFAYLCYDREHIYVGFYCKDSQPDSITALETKRGGRTGRDDNVRVYLDVQHGHREQYEFRVTARGTQEDYIPGGSAEKVEWRGDWRAAARIVQDGWVAEMAIPFSILRYPTGQTVFGVCFARRLRRTDEFSYWPRMENGVRMRAYADWVGVQTPRIARRPVAMPYVQVDADRGDVEVLSGADAKHTFENGIVAVATVNPDFRNVEKQVLGIDFSYTEKYRAETRPFFKEGESGNPRSQLFYSPRIDRVDVGVKAFGRIGRNSFSFLDTVNVGDRNDLMARYSCDFDDYNSATVAFVHRAQPGLHNAVGGVEYSHYRPIGQGGLSIGSGRAESRTSGPGGDGHAQALYLSRWFGENRISADVGYEEISPAYTALNGYVPETDFRALNLGVGKTRRWDEGRWRAYGWRISAGEAERTDGALFHRDLSISSWFSLRNGTGGNWGYSYSKRPPDNNRTFSAGYSWGRNSLYQSGGVAFTLGRLGGGDYRFFSLSQGFELNDRLNASVRYEHARHARAGQPARRSSQTVVSGNYDISQERGYGFRLVAQDDQYNFYASYRQTVRRGLDLFIILGDPNTTQSRARLAIKAVHTY
jgi:hypothetical protein